jgi:pimeloyl-ACP methyl ester carboxylesterase
MKRYLDFGSLPNETDESLAARQNEFAIHFGRADVGADREYDSLKLELTGGMACYATFLSMGMEHDYSPACRDSLRGTTFPVAIVHGAMDIVPESTSRKYVDLFPPENVSFEVLQEANHFVYDHSRVADIVKETLARR